MNLETLMSEEFDEVYQKIKELKDKKTSRKKEMEKLVEDFKNEMKSIDNEIKTLYDGLDKTD